MSWPLKIVDDFGHWFASKLIGYMYTDGCLPPLVPVYPLMWIANAALVGALGLGLFTRGAEFVLPFLLSVTATACYWVRNREHLSVAMTPWTPDLHALYNQRARAARADRSRRIARLSLALLLTGVIYGLDRSILDETIKWQLYVMVLYAALWTWHSYAVAADLPAYEPNDPFHRADEVSR